MAKKLAGIILLTAAVSGCAKYGELGSNPILGGGFRDMDGVGKLHKVYFLTTMHSTSSVSDSILVRCAEIAKAKNKPYFAMYNSVPDAIRGNAQSKVVEWSSFFTKEAQVYILLSEKNQPGYLSADQIFLELGPKVKGSKS